ncbi:MAG: hypothetical protein J7518_20785 [Nocardioidaceae bacterium]|nr:hypothetical protein [Nocardioidaceae bacterium]
MDGIVEVLAVLEAITSSAFGLVSQISEAARSTLSRPLPRRSGELTRLDPVITAGLAPGGVVHGAGFVAGVGALEDARWWLEWFARDAEDRPQRLVVQSDPQAVGFYDYEHLPWYAVPHRTGQRHVTGPYVDYLCTDDYTLTFTIPVVVDEVFLGVGGADVKVATAEQLLLPALRSTSTPLAVINEHGRILSSNSGRRLSGDLVSGPADVAALWADPDSSVFRRVADLPLAVVALEALPA